jgi:hypothetical protein
MAGFMQATGVLSRHVPAGVLLLAPGDGEAVLLAGTGEAVWDALLSPISLEELTETLGAAYRAPVSVIRDDVETTVDRLVSLGLLELRP